MYLDSDTLHGYVSTLEQGLRQSIERSSGKDGGGEAGVDAKLIKAQAKLGTSSSTSETLSDTDSARFDRWLSAAIVMDKVEEVLQPEMLSEAPIGRIVKFDCEVEVPQFAALLRSPEILEAFQGIAKFGSSFGAGGIDAAQVEQMSGFAKALKTDTLPIRGEFDDSDWAMYSILPSKWIKGEFDGFVTVVGKVRKILAEGDSKMLLSLPGMSVLNRKQRKELENKPRKDDEDDQYVDVPAVQIEALAIYT